MTPTHPAAHYAHLARTARVEATARALLKVVDHPVIRKAALAANFALYEARAALIDALDAEPVRVEAGELVLVEYGRGHAWLRAEGDVA